MSLPSGYYAIISNQTKAEIGRRFREDLSLLPKMVVTCSPDRNNPWEINQTNSGKYIIKSNGSPLMTRDGKVFVDLMQQDPVTEWDILPIDNPEDNVFSISTNGQFLSLDSSNELDKQLETRPNSPENAGFLIQGREY